jgi:hypothetical protein
MIRRPLHTAFTITISAFALSGCSLLATLEDAQAIEEVINELPDYTDATAGDIPDTGTAGFTGHLALGDTSSEFILADLAATADYSTGNIDGAASQIRLIDGGAENPLSAVSESFSGSVDWTGSITGTTVATSGNGTISAGGTDYTLDFIANGDFYKNSEDKLTMASETGVSGSLTPDGGSTIEYTDGAFYAAED